jgi:hypothetical protein
MEINDSDEANAGTSAAETGGGPHPVIKVYLPPGCDRRALSIDALDARTRELAYATHIKIDGRPVFCRGFKLREVGGETVLVLEVQPASYEIVPGESE